jgi:hypothetical protein
VQDLEIAIRDSLYRSHSLYNHLLVQIVSSLPQHCRWSWSALVWAWPRPEHRALYPPQQLVLDVQLPSIFVALRRRHDAIARIMDMVGLEEELRGVQLRMLRMEAAITGDVITRLLRLEGTILEGNRLLHRLFPEESPRIPAQFAPIHRHDQNPSAALVSFPASESNEHNRLCTFPNCPDSAGGKTCSGTAAARHMAACPHCPNEAQRFCHIAHHMGTFLRHPRVVDQDTCCWCLQKFQEDISDTIRTRHRKSCRVVQIVTLTDPERQVAKSAQLSLAWMSISPMQRRKRERGTFSPPLKPMVLDSSQGDVPAADGFAVMNEREHHRLTPLASPSGLDRSPPDSRRQYNDQFVVASDDGFVMFDPRSSGASDAEGAAL